MIDIEPNCGYCELVDREKKPGVGLCGECPYNHRMIPHFKPHHSIVAYLKQEKTKAPAV